MKITKPDVIKNGEKNLMEGIKDDLDLDAVKEILNKKMGETALAPKDGEIVVYNNKIAFKMNFDFHLRGSLMFDRQGNYIPESDQGHEIKTDLSVGFDDNTSAGENREDNDMQIVRPEDNSEDQLEPENEDHDTGQNKLIEEDDDILDEDDDINDILDESREFWEHKKDS